MHNCLQRSDGPQAPERVEVSQILEESPIKPWGTALLHPEVQPCYTLRYIPSMVQGATYPAWYRVLHTQHGQRVLHTQHGQRVLHTQHGREGYTQHGREGYTHHGTPCYTPPGYTPPYHALPGTSLQCPSVLRVRAATSVCRRGCPGL